MVLFIFFKWLAIENSSGANKMNSKTRYFLRK
jgi:hypothetical protein